MERRNFLKGIGLSLAAIAIPISLSFKKKFVADTYYTFPGVFNSRYRVCIDPEETPGKCQPVGYKGITFWDTPMYYAPYIPLDL